MLKESYVMKHVAKLEYIALRVLFRLILGKKRRNKLMADGTINIDNWMAKHFMNRSVGLLFKSLNRNRFLTFFDGFWLVVLPDDAWIVEEVRSVYLKPEQGDVVIDAGAHYGFYALLSSRLVGREGLVIAFEPASENYRCLLANLQLNKTKNVKPFNMALGDLDGETKLYLGDHSREHSMIYQRSKRFEFVQLKRLDTIIDELGLTKVNLIKLDTEGAELTILRGALLTIKRYKPRLTIAAYHSPTESNEIAEWLKENAPFYHIVRTNKGFVHAV